MISRKEFQMISTALITLVPHFNDKRHYQCQQTCRIGLCGKRKALSSQVKLLSFSLIVQRTKDLNTSQSWASSSSVSYNR